MNKNANVWQVNDAIAAPVGSGETVAVERLVDPTVALDLAEALVPRADTIRGGSTVGSLDSPDARSVAYG